VYRPCDNLGAKRGAVSIQNLCRILAHSAQVNFRQLPRNAASLLFLVRSAEGQSRQLGSQAATSAQPPMNGYGQRSRHERQRHAGQKPGCRSFIRALAYFARRADCACMPCAICPSRQLAARCRCCALPQITSIIRAVPHSATRGASRSSRTLSTGCGGRGSVGCDDIAGRAKLVSEQSSAQDERR
jgi:hypothetical protein